MSYPKPVYTCMSLLILSKVIETDEILYIHGRVLGPISPKTNEDVDASWKLVLTCDSVWPLMHVLTLTLIKFEFTLLLTQVYHHLATQCKLTRVSLTVVFTSMNEHAKPHWNGFLQLVSDYTLVCLATHCKFVCATWHFQTCDDLQFCLAKALWEHNLISDSFWSTAIAL